ncbi:trypsin-like serine protease, partial [Neoconidiobolus thromboides FSU 785]
RIVNGTEVSPKFRYPFMISLDYHGKHVCGGTLLNKNTVVTAAHCINATESDWTISFHRHNMNLTSLQEHGKDLKILKRIPHPKYYLGESSINYDIAIYKIEPIKGFNLRLKLDYNDISSQTGKGLTVLGWGRLYEDGPYSYVLRQVDVPVYDINQCKISYPLLDTGSQFCAGYKEGWKNVCQADSGGPILSFEGEPTIVGIVSWGKGCALKDYPAVFTRISTSVDFINKYA